MDLFDCASCTVAVRKWYKPVKSPAAELLDCPYEEAKIRKWFRDLGISNVIRKTETIETFEIIGPGISAQIAIT